MFYTMLLFNVCLLFTVFLLKKILQILLLIVCFLVSIKCFIFIFQWFHSVFIIFPTFYETLSLFSFFLLNINRNVLGVASWVLVPNAESWDIRVRASASSVRWTRNSNLTASWWSFNRMMYHWFWFRQRTFFSVVHIQDILQTAGVYWHDTHEKTEDGNLSVHVFGW